MGYQRISNQGLCNPEVRDLSFIHRDVSRVGGFVLTRQEAARKWGRRPTPWSARDGVREQWPSAIVVSSRTLVSNPCPPLFAVGRSCRSRRRRKLRP
jgi:hypothetical protein